MNKHNRSMKLKRRARFHVKLGCAGVVCGLALGWFAEAQSSGSSAGLLSTKARAATQAGASSDLPMADLRQNSAVAPAMVEMKSINFEPKAIQVVTGQKVIWKNTSYTQHSATGDAAKAGESEEASRAGKGSAASLEASFDTGLVDPKKESKPVVFTTPGTYPYHCSIHGKTMSGVVIVRGQN